MIASDLDDCAQLSSEPAQPQTPNGKSNEEFQPVHDTLPTPRLQLQKPWTQSPHPTHEQEGVFSGTACFVAPLSLLVFWQVL